MILDTIQNIISPTTNSEFETNQNIYQQARGGTYLILPLYNHSKGDYKSLENQLAYTKAKVPSTDFTPFLADLCEKGSYVRRYKKSIEGDTLVTTDESGNCLLNSTEYELFIFQNKIAFISIYFEYENKNIHTLYKKVQPGYLSGDHQDIGRFVSQVLVKLNAVPGLHFELYSSNTINESYCFNMAMVGTRFQHLETLDQLTFNLHKLIPLTKKFEDASEKDIAFTYGARDVELETYRWGACISSQSISYVYAGSEDADIQETGDDDYLLTMLVLNQKYFCMGLNDELYTVLGDKNRSTKRMNQLQRDALQFRAIGTLAPTQVSRWYNVCETYRHLVELNGVNEALEEIEFKLDLIKADHSAEVERIQGFIAGGVTLFGLISIVASILTVVDLLSGGSVNIMTAFTVSSIVVIIYFALCILWLIKKKR